HAQDNLTVGTVILGTDGAQVGTIERVDGANVLVNTGSVTAALPASSIATGEKGATIAWTKAELEAAVNQANAEAAAQLAGALVEGAEVYSSDSVLLGTVESV